MNRMINHEFQESYNNYTTYKNEKC